MLKHFHACEERRLSNDDLGAARGRRISGAVFSKTGDFVKKWFGGGGGGATVERLHLAGATPHLTDRKIYQLKACSSAQRGSLLHFAVCSSLYVAGYLLMASLFRACAHTRKVC